MIPTVGSTMITCIQSGARSMAHAINPARLLRQLTQDSVEISSKVAMEGSQQAPGLFSRASEACSTFFKNLNKRLFDTLDSIHFGEAETTSGWAHDMAAEIPVPTHEVDHFPWFDGISN